METLCPAAGLALEPQRATRLIHGLPIARFRPKDSIMQDILWLGVLLGLALLTFAYLRLCEHA
jgi:hypothetical protein